MRLDAGASALAPARPAPIVSYEWEARDGNPAPLAGLPARGKRVELAAPAVDGEYYVTLRVTDSAGRSDRSVAVFRVQDGRPAAVDLARTHPAWADSAVVYGLSPYFFGLRDLRDVRAQLDDLQALGINTLWLSPITATPDGDFGYAVTDYFHLRDGGEADLHALVEAAHARKMRIILDLAVNHVSNEHRYFKDAQERGAASPYYDFFDRDAAGGPTHYFDWRNLENLNYDDPEVKRWVIEAFAYWLRRFDVDGFRVDAAWGPQRRAPEFWGAWRAEMKRIKPDVLLLAEASARDPYYFQNGFDAAYDWTSELGKWAWAPAFEDRASTARKLRDAILASRSQQGSDGLVFRFLDNNDTGARFVTRYGVARTRLAAALLLTLPGLPALYWGDEIGAEYVPYHVVPPHSWEDDDGLRPWYARLIALREAEPALRSNRIRFLDVAPEDRLLAYVRPSETPAEDVVVLLNWGDTALSVPRASLPGGTEGFADLLGGEGVAPAAASIALPAYGLRVLRGIQKEERPPEGGLSVTNAR